MAEESTIRAHIALLSIAIALGGSLAHAQPADELATVATRQRESLDPLGIRTGSFRIFPELGLEHAKDSNVFATRDARASDTVLVLTPAVTFRSDWSRNSFDFGVSAAINDYSDFDTEDHDDRSAFVRGRWETANDGFFYGNYDSSVDHEGRESVDDARGLERTQIDTDEVSIGYRVEPGRMLFQVEIESRDSDFHDVAGIGGVVNNDDRDRTGKSTRLRGGYRVSDGYAVFLQRSDRSIDYDSVVDDNGFNRNAEGDETVVGAELDLTDVIFGDVYFGRKSYSYDDARFSDIKGNAFGIGIDWNVTRLTTFRFDGHQEVTPTTVIGAAGIDETEFMLGADHELLRNLILSLEWSRREDDFKGIERKDENHSITFGARYLMNRRFEIEFEYVSHDRDSTTAANREYSRNLVGIRFTGQL